MIGVSINMVTHDILYMTLINMTCFPRCFSLVEIGKELALVGVKLPLPIHVIVVGVIVKHVNI
jgi:hypothetical protein